MCNLLVSASSCDTTTEVTAGGEPHQPATADHLRRHDHGPGRAREALAAAPGDYRIHYLLADQYDSAGYVEVTVRAN